MSTAVCYGIDLGTTNSCLAIYSNDNPIMNPCVVENLNSQLTTPSVVSFGDKQVLVGKSALAMRRINPENTIYNIKRLIGRKFSDPVLKRELERLPYTLRKGNGDIPIICVNDKRLKETYLHPEQISAFILHFLKISAETKCGNPTNKVMIAVPANFNDYQRRATMDAAKIAGLDPIGVIAEPTAACIAHAYNMGYYDGIRHILVYDFGGGTLDVSILKIEGCNFTVLATAGDSHCGGADIDQELFNIVLHRIKENGFTLFDNEGNYDTMDVVKKRLYSHISELCEEAKRNLSTSTFTDMIIDEIECGKPFKCRLYRADIDNIINQMMQKLMDPIDTVLQKIYNRVDLINNVILVGGSSNIPEVNNLIRAKLRNVKFSSINPDEVIAIGAAIYGAFKCGEIIKGFPELKIVDVTPMAIGYGTKTGVVQVAIPKNFPIPTISEPEAFRISGPNMKKIILEIFQGDSRFMKDCYSVGKFEIDLPKNLDPDDEKSRIFQCIEVNDNEITLFASIGKNPSDNIHDETVSKLMVKMDKPIFTIEEITEMRNKNFEMINPNTEEEERNYLNDAYKNIISVRVLKNSFTKDREEKKKIDNITENFKKSLFQQYSQHDIMNKEQYTILMSNFENEIKEICPGYSRPKKFVIHP